MLPVNTLPIFWHPGDRKTKSIKKMPRLLAATKLIRAKSTFFAHAPLIKNVIYWCSTLTGIRLKGTKRFGQSIIIWM